MSNHILQMTTTSLTTIASLSQTWTTIIIALFLVVIIVGYSTDWFGQKAERNSKLKYILSELDTWLKAEIPGGSFSPPVMDALSISFGCYEDVKTTKERIIKLFEDHLCTKLDVSADDFKIIIFFRSREELDFKVSLLWEIDRSDIPRCGAFYKYHIVLG